MHHLDIWVKRDQLDVTCFIISLFIAQHVSDVNTSILRTLRLICWVISWVLLLWFDVCWCYVVVRLWWCGMVWATTMHMSILMWCITLGWILLKQTFNIFVLLVFSIQKRIVTADILVISQRRRLWHDKPMCVYFCKLVSQDVISQWEFLVRRYHIYKDL